nr:transposase [Streptomyces sp. A108]
MTEAATLTICAGVDIGKEHHHCVALDARSERRLSRRVGNDEPELLELIGDVLAPAEPGEVLWAMDTNRGSAALLIGILRRGLTTVIGKFYESAARADEVSGLDVEEPVPAGQAGEDHRQGRGAPEDIEDLDGALTDDRGRLIAPSPRGRLSIIDGDDQIRVDLQPEGTAVPLDRSVESRTAQPLPCRKDVGDRDAELGSWNIRGPLLAEPLPGGPDSRRRPSLAAAGRGHPQSCEGFVHAADVSDGQVRAL